MAGTQYKTAKHGEWYVKKDGTTNVSEKGFLWDANKDDGKGGWIVGSEFREKYGLLPEVDGNVEAPVVVEKRKRGRPTKEEAAARRAKEQATATASFNIEDEAKNALMDIFIRGARVNLEEVIQAQAASATADIVEYVDAIREEILSLESRKIVVQGPLATKTLTGTRHMTFDTLLQTVGAGLSAMLVGPAGSGKTYASEQVAEALELPFYAISVGAQTSKSDLFGYMDGNGNYHGTMFRQAYEHGGVFLMDEIDAANANVLVLLNSALAGSSTAFPDRQDMVRKHENFRFIATANTFGMGASRQYVGRNQIDAATLDRFVTLEWPIDTILEAATVAQFENGARWHNVVMKVREQVDKNEWRVVVSPRATIKGAQLLDIGIPFEQVLEMTLLGTASKDQRPLITTTARGAW